LNGNGRREKGGRKERGRKYLASTSTTTSKNFQWEVNFTLALVLEQPAQ
jgi:hypothetical protein